MTDEKRAEMILALAFLAETDATAIALEQIATEFRSRDAKDLSTTVSRSIRSRQPANRELDLAILKLSRELDCG
jgi:hypothetical protein